MFRFSYIKKYIFFTLVNPCNKDKGFPYDYFTYGIVENPKTEYLTILICKIKSPKFAKKNDTQKSK